jgi:hypothetical protein
MFGIIKPVDREGFMGRTQNSRYNYNLVQGCGVCFFLYTIIVKIWHGFVLEDESTNGLIGI